MTADTAHDRPLAGQSAPSGPETDIATETASGRLEHPEATAEELTAPALQAAARQAWLANPDLIGAELGARFGRSERWGRDRIAEARAATADTAGGPSGNGTAAKVTSNGNGSRPQRQPQRPNGGRVPTAANGRRAAARAGAGSSRSRSVPVEVPGALMVVTVVAVAVVAVVTMLTSYSHTHDLAVLAGQGETLAMVLPAAVDGLVIAGSTSLLVDHRAGRDRNPFAWAAVVIGLASSLGANVVAVDPTVIDLRVVRWVMAGYAPVALAISGHLLLQMLGHHTPRPARAETEASQ
jgi:hypothetical protein